MNKNLTAWLLYLVALYCLGRALGLWREYDYDKGYADAHKDIERTWEDKAIARRLAAEADRDNERTS